MSENSAILRINDVEFWSNAQLHSCLKHFFAPLDGQLLIVFIVVLEPDNTQVSMNIIVSAAPSFLIMLRKLSRTSLEGEHQPPKSKIKS